MVYAVVTVFILAAIIVQICIARQQTRKMEAQLAETAKSAEAAKRSADALIEIERSWIVVQMSKTLVPANFKPDPSRLEILWIPYKISNRGKTTASITKSAAGWLQLKTLKDLPEKPNYDACTVGIGSETTFLPDLGVTLNNVGISTSHLPEILNGQIAFAFLGYVDYLDVFDRPHQTRPLGR
jgi:hypothetical protein